MRELESAAADNHIDVATQLQVPYKLHTIRVDDIHVLDLRATPEQIHVEGSQHLTFDLYRQHTS